METVFWIVISSLFIYEAIAIWSNNPGDTISEIIWRISAGRPIIPFLFGLLMGHFFFTRNGPLR